MAQPYERFMGASLNPLTRLRRKKLIKHLETVRKKGLNYHPSWCMICMPSWIKKFFFLSSSLLLLFFSWWFEWKIPFDSVHYFGNSMMILRWKWDLSCSLSALKSKQKLQIWEFILLQVLMLYHLCIHFLYYFASFRTRPCCWCSKSKSA